MKLILALMFISVSAMAQRPTGTLILGTPNSTNCVSGFSCHNATVVCPDVIEPRPTPLILARMMTNVLPVKGTLFLLGGHAGNNWWSAAGDESSQFMQRMNSAGYDVIQVRYNGNGWPQAWGYQQGFVRLANRPATTIKWVHDNWHRAGEFLVSGSSEGSAGVAYSAAAYGISQYTDRIIYVSGPPMGDLVEACTSADPKWHLVFPGETSLVDQPWGFPARVGPCSTHSTDPFWIDQWRSNSADTVSGGSYLYLFTKVGIIVGGRDAWEILNRATRLYNVYAQNGQPNLSFTTIPTMQHTIQKSTQGLDALFQSLTQ